MGLTNIVACNEYHGYMTPIDPLILGEEVLLSVFRIVFTASLLGKDLIYAFAIRILAACLFPLNMCTTVHASPQSE